MSECVRCCVPTTCSVAIRRNLCDVLQPVLTHCTYLVQLTTTHRVCGLRLLARCVCVCVCVACLRWLAADSVADVAGLLVGDEILSINGTQTKTSSHTNVAEIISSKTHLAVKVCTRYVLHALYTTVWLTMMLVYALLPWLGGGSVAVSRCQHCQNIRVANKNMPRLCDFPLSLSHADCRSGARVKHVAPAKLR